MHWYTACCARRIQKQAVASGISAMSPNRLMDGGRMLKGLDPARGLLRCEKVLWPQARPMVCVDNCTRVVGLPHRIHSRWP